MSNASRRIARRLGPDRPKQELPLTIYADVVEDLEWVASRLGFSGPKALIRAYVGQGLRRDLERLDGELEKEINPSPPQQNS